MLTKGLITAPANKSQFYVYTSRGDRTIEPDAGFPAKPKEIALNSILNAAKQNILNWETLETNQSNPRHDHQYRVFH